MMSNACYGNNTVFKKEDIDSGAESGITCFRKESMAIAAILKHPNGNSVNLDSGVVLCVIGNGHLTSFTLPNFGTSSNGQYTCCITGSCISAIYRILKYNDILHSYELLEVKSIQ